MNPNSPESRNPDEPSESFGDLLAQFEQSQSRKKTEAGNQQLEGTVIAVKAESVYLNIGFKSEGILPLAAFQGSGETVKPGDKYLVSVKGRDQDGYYELSRFKIAQPTDWSTLEQAFANKATIVGTITGVVKGGLSVDVGVRAFMPASRSGAQDAGEIERLVGQEIRCRIIKLEVTDEDIVVDRRVVAEEEARSTKERRYSEIKEGETVRGIIRSFTDYGAFVDIGGADGLLHVSDIAWGRVARPEDVLSLGQEIEVKVLKIDSEKHRISLGMKQLQAQPWDSAAEKYKLGQRARGVVTRVLEFGAFVELEPGVEGLIHLSELSWTRKAKKPSDVLKPGETIEAVILGIDVEQRRISLGLRQALGDPWVEVTERFGVGSVIEGSVTSITKFGAFVQIIEGVEGMIHVSEISAEKRINHPQDVLRVGQTVKALLLEMDREKRQIRLSMKQLIPTSLDEYLVEHKAGDVVTGRVVEFSGEVVSVELGEGIRATCRIPTESLIGQQNTSQSKTDIASLTSMLQARWKSGSTSESSKPETVAVGQVRKFEITDLDSSAKQIELKLAR
jgi:small subunit ribosomal protein S1